MINEMIEIFKNWSPFYQFVFSILVFYFVFYILSDILTHISNFINDTLPILLRGWPKSFDTFEIDDGTEEQKEDKTK